MTSVVEKKTRVVSAEDSAKMAEQAETGAIMDRLAKHEQFLMRNKQEMNTDDSLLLYRLPLSDEQREAVYKKLVG